MKKSDYIKRRAVNIAIREFCYQIGRTLRKIIYGKMKTGGKR